MNRAFTLIELLVVIAIIGVLSSVVLASLNASREKAKVARTLQDFREIEKAFYLFADDQNRTTWWLETDFGLGNNPTIGDLVANTGLGNFLPAAPRSPLVSTSYTYDHDGPVFTCGGNSYDGVNIVLNGISAEVATALDDMIDGGDGDDCGKFTYGGSPNIDIFYKLSADGSF